MQAATDQAYFEALEQRLKKPTAHEYPNNRNDDHREKKLDGFDYWLFGAHAVFRMSKVSAALHKSDSNFTKLELNAIQISLSFKRKLDKNSNKIKTIVFVIMELLC